MNDFVKNSAKRSATPRRNILSRMDDVVVNFAAHMRRGDFTIREIGNLCLIGVIANIYFLANFSLSIDDELGATRIDRLIWIGQGRWTVYLIERFLFPQPAIPYSPFIVLLTCFALSYALLIRAHGYQPNWKTYASYPLFITFPCWWLISEFYSNVPAIGIGLLLVCMSVYLTYRNSRPDSLRSFPGLRDSALAAVMLATAMGAYQSFALLYLCAAAGVALVRSMRSGMAGGLLHRHLCARALQVGMLLLAAGAMYAVINYAAQHISGAYSPYIAGFIRPENFQHPRWLLFSVAREAWHVYSGSSSIYGVSMPLAAVVALAASLSILLFPLKKALVNLLLWGVVLGAPFALHLLSGAGRMPVRSMLALAYVTWLMAMLLISRSRPLALAASLALILLYQIQIINVTSQYSAAASITQAHDQILAADLYRRIGEQSSDFDPDRPIIIDVYGHKPNKSVYAQAPSSTTQASFFDWDNGSMMRMMAYMKVLGYQNIKALPDEERVALTPLFQDMPVWPAAGSVRKVGQRYLIKLSRDPDPVHARRNP
jgi:hypothetical protein